MATSPQDIAEIASEETEETSGEVAAEDIEQLSAADRLALLSNQANITPYLEEQLLGEWGDRALRGFEDDLSSRAEWELEIEDIRRIAGQNLYDDTKVYPWPDASNLTYPLMTVAALQFNARAYPAIVNSGTPALARVIGKDTDGEKQKRATRVSSHMSWQLMEEMEDWEEETDRLLLTLPLEGCAFRKVWFDPSRGRNVSELVLATDLVVNNYAKNLTDCPRISQRTALYPHEIAQKIALGVFRDADFGSPAEDEHAPVEFIEQHTWFDIDGDDRPEPYIVTVSRETGEVARVVANFDARDIVVDSEGRIAKITPRKYFIKYECFPDPEGSFYSKGFGQLLRPLNDAVDSLVNMLIDAGHLSNVQGGFIAKGFRVDSGALRFTPGEWKKVDTGGAPMKDAILPLPVREPSQVLFAMLGLLVDAAKEISSVSEVMSGGPPPANTPATTVLSLIEQGMKVYTAIFKRIWRSMKQEFKLLYDLNARHLDPEQYKRVLDDPDAIAEQDYETVSLDIVPAADPSMSTDIQRAARTQMLLGFIQFPGANPITILEEAMRTAGIEEPERFMAPEQQGPTPEQAAKLFEMQIKQKEMLFKGIEQLASAFEKAAKSDELGADNLLNMKELIIAARELIGDGSQGSGQQGGPQSQPGRSPAVEGGQSVVPGSSSAPQSPV